MDFAHLRVHSHYSLLQGMIRIPDLLSAVASHGQRSVALTDTHQMFGAMEFYFAAKERGIHPVFGADVFIVSDSRARFYEPRPGKDISFTSLVLLAKTTQGYKNLCRILSESYQSLPREKKGIPFPELAVIDPFLLKKYSEGVLAIEGGLRSSYFPLWRNSGTSQWKDLLDQRRSIFGNDYYISLERHGLPEESELCSELRGFAARESCPLLITNNVHYLRPEQAEAHEVLQCIELGRSLDPARSQSYLRSSFDLKSTQKMMELFPEDHEALARTGEIAQLCQVSFRLKDGDGKPIYHLPNFRPSHWSDDATFSIVDYFCQSSREGLRHRFQSSAFRLKCAAVDWPEKEAIYWTRLEDELRMIERTGFSSYFLIVADFIQEAKRRGIPVGPGRGSGAGSLVAYALSITDIDPIEFQLLFERFINPERISMPDFDIDFCQDRRGEVIQYVVDRYGSDRVSQIVTFGKLQAKAVLKDVGRVYGLSFAETNELTKLFPDELNIKLQDAFDREPRLKEKLAQNQLISRVFQVALELEGMARATGIHAAGVIITEEAIPEYCPLFVGREGDRVTAFDKDYSEKIGLIKFDFLGLKTLTVIDRAVCLIRERSEPQAQSLELSSISLGDEKVFATIGSGDTDGIFQIESDGMKSLCQRLAPNCIEDLVAICALYRPGPLGSGMVDDFIDRKHGRKAVEYPVPQLESILKETYGVIVYQEQVMQIARELSGYSLGQADLLRRAMGKKKPEEMAKQKQTFLQGAERLGTDPATAAGIFDLIAKFAEYGFNKSHSAAYAVISYQTAFLKTYYPVEFMAALMTTDAANTEKITKYIADFRTHGSKVLPPDINRSKRTFTVEDQGGESCIRFGLEAIKGIGEAAIEAILMERQSGGEFVNLMDFLSRLPARKVNRKVLESLMIAGALDTMSEVSRATLLASLDALLAFASAEVERRESAQASLFDQFQTQSLLVRPTLESLLTRVPEPSLGKKLAMERSVLGIYLSGHPLERWKNAAKLILGERDFSEAGRALLLDLAPVPDTKERNYARKRPSIEVLAILEDVREFTTKTGKRMAVVRIDLVSAHLEVVVFPDRYAELETQLKQWTQDCEPLGLLLEVDMKATGEISYLLGAVWPAEEMFTRVRQVELCIEEGVNASPSLLRELKASILSHRGRVPVVLLMHACEFVSKERLEERLSVSVSLSSLESWQQLLGPAAVTFQLEPQQPVQEPSPPRWGGRGGQFRSQNANTSFAKSMTPDTIKL